MTIHKWLIASGALAAAMTATAQQPPSRPAPVTADVKVAQASDGRCRKDVKDYVETLRFVRENAGVQIGDKIAAGYVTESELDKVVASQGHCAAAQLLKDRRAIR